MVQLCNRAFADEALGGGTRVTTPVIALNDAGDRIPIFWFPSVSGVGTDPLKFAFELGPDQPFYSLRVRSERRTGRHGADLKGVAREFARAIVDQKGPGPVILGAWSAGTIAALETLPLLKSLGVRVSCLIVIDHVPEHPPTRLSLRSRSIYRPILSIHRLASEADSCRDFFIGLLHKILDQVLPRLTRVFGCSPPPCHPMSQSDWYGRLGPEHRQFVESFHDVCAAYRPARCDVRVLLFVATRNVNSFKQRTLDALISPWSMAARWRDLAPVVQVQAYEGDHETFKTSPAAIAAALRVETPCGSDTPG